METTDKKFSDIKLIAFYLPQFFPFPENDRWWGKGFTEWTNVTKARPLFEGHYQPHLPTDFGFYDLRVRETRRDQIKIAKQYGIEGFCYHYYWFSGKRLLDIPVDDMLKDRESDMPFCLCWANENWTRRWDAKEHEVLIAQDYSNHDDAKFIDDLVPFLKDDRYIEVSGRKLLIVYRPQQIPNVKDRTVFWKERCRRNGIELHLCAALTHGNLSYNDFGFDSGVEFPPHTPNVANDISGLQFFADFEGSIIDFQKIAQTYLTRKYDEPDVYKCVFPSWDNSARRKEKALVILNGIPDNFELWLRGACQLTRERFPEDRRLVFINAWNEWAEGCHLEPDQLHGRKFFGSGLPCQRGAICCRSFCRDSDIELTAGRRTKELGLEATS